ncbi:5-oxoprolinase subunit B/C family protein [Puerhibacterium puerhi]|uniref:5-oxoprolinase subunit B/C family protein n=1 Tax=Puerhibacterium puerhi TaxID=2692623 RepID=UPI00135B8B52|nr:carboxyltransferase domain-containing protein [Puerhibacterium puerhi]
MRILPARDDAVLVELADLDQAVALLESLTDDPVPGVGEPVAGARTVLVPFRPSAMTAAALAAELRRRPLVRRPVGRSRRVEIPTVYDGADLAAVAALLGWSPAELVRRHTALTWVVGYMGFAPGFAYLTAEGGPGADVPAWPDVPRRPSPRTHVPAGSVALAGPHTGVYPRESPGGWQLVGRTAARVWDTSREPPSLWRPGDLVRFVAVRERASAGGRPPAATAEARPAAPAPASREPTSGEPADAPLAGALVVVSPGVQTLVQDLGRPGRAHLGVAASGALDPVSLRAANRAVGNPPGAAALEVIGPLRLRARGPQVVAVAGAPAPVTVLGLAPDDHPAGRPRRTPATATAAGPAAIALDDGEELRLGTPRRGARTYVAVRGGVAVPPVLGSRSTDVLAGLGPAPAAAGDVLPVGAVGPGLPAAAPGLPDVPGRAAADAAHADAVDAIAPLPSPGGDAVVLHVVLGPRADWFGDAGIAALTDQDWEVTPRSNRVGLRLAGAPVPWARPGELPSEGCVVGALQVPPDGQPVLFLADHPVTGGYPVVGAVVAAQAPLLGQLPAGARVRFVPVPHAAQGETPNETLGETPNETRSEAPA